MSESNLRQSLEAAEQALAHFNRSLAESGFEAGAASYQKMADILIGQWLWAEEQQLDDYNERFRQLAALAGRVHEQLLPYVEAMRRLTTLAELVPPPSPPVAPDSRERRILATLRKAPRPLSATALRKEIGGSTQRLRKTMQRLIDDGLVETRRAGSRVLYAPGQASDDPAGNDERP